MIPLDEDALALARDHNLREDSIRELREAFLRGASLAQVLRQKIGEDRLSGTKARVLIIAAFAVSAVECQKFGLWWEEGIISDNEFDEIIRSADAEQNAEWSN